MKLLIVAQVADRDDDVLGAFHQWIARFAEVFDSVDVICLRKGAIALPANVRVHSLGKEEKPSRWRYVSRFYRYAFGLRKDYDVVFVHMNPEYVVLMGLFWRLMGKTVFLWYAHKKGGFLRTLALAFLDRVVSVSKESFVDNASKKFIAVGHGIDPDVYRCDAPVAGGRKIILSVGRLSHVKEYDLLIDAIALLKRRRTQADFFVRLVGGPANPEDVAYVARLKEKIARLGLAGLFEFAGPMPNKDILPQLCAASSFVSMQDGGGAGKSFLEAMSCGVPTVVRTPVFNDLFGPWLPSLYYDGTPEDFAAKLDACLSLGEADRARMGATLRNIVVERHDLKKLVRRLKDEYESLRARR
ncbi:MAG: glycosyltransferase family 4 protein [Patescibacteria group bacterium]